MYEYASIKEIKMENEVIKNILNRHSCKKYKSDAVPDEMIETIVNAGLNAPSGKNNQAPIILAVSNKELRDRLSKLNASILNANIDPFYNAPVVLVVLADKNCFTYLYDGSLVMENMLLTASSLGLGSCWIHRAKEMFEAEEGKQILKELGIPENYEGIGNCIIGYSDMELKSHPIKENRVYYVK